MSAARLTHVLDADFTEVAEQRRADRRAGDRRTLPARLDTMFAAVLVNHVAKPERPRANAYGAQSLRLRAGVVVNFEA